MSDPRAPLLILAVGNPSRGDDALGPLFIERAEDALAPEIAAGEVELLTDFQLQIEHALDLEGRREVIFVDASVTATSPFAFEPLAARRDESAFSHAMSPAAVLELHQRVVGAPPAAFLLGIRGERFELGEGLSETAAAGLAAALAFLVERIRSG